MLSEAANVQLTLLSYSQGEAHYFSAFSCVTATWPLIRGNDGCVRHPGGLLLLVSDFNDAIVAEIKLIKQSMEKSVLASNHVPLCMAAKVKTPES